MSWLLNSAPATTARWSTGTPWWSWRLPTSSAEPEAPIAEFRSRHQGAFVSAVRHHGQIMDQLFFDQYDTQVGVIGVLAGPAGLRATGWRLDARGAAIEPDETVQQTIGQLREYFAGQRRSFELTPDLPPLPTTTEAVLRALMKVEYRETINKGEVP